MRRSQPVSVGQAVLESQPACVPGQAVLELQDDAEADWSSAVNPFFPPRRHDQKPRSFFQSHSPEFNPLAHAVKYSRNLVVTDAIVAFSPHMWLWIVMRGRPGAPNSHIFTSTSYGAYIWEAREVRMQHGELEMRRGDRNSSLTEIKWQHIINRCAAEDIRGWPGSTSREQRAQGGRSEIERAQRRSNSMRMTALDSRAERRPTRAVHKISSARNSERQYLPSGPKPEGSGLARSTGREGLNR